MAVLNARPFRPRPEGQSHTASIFVVLPCMRSNRKRRRLSREGIAIVTGTRHVGNVWVRVVTFVSGLRVNRR
jgi:hypothetical protein